MQSVNKLYQTKYFKKKIDKFRYSSSIFSKIVTFNNKVLEGFKLLEDDGIEINDRYYEYIIELDELASNNLCIDDFNDFNKAFSAIRSSELLIDNGILNKDLECITEGLYGLGFILEDLGILKQR